MEDASVNTHFREMTESKRPYDEIEENSRIRMNERKQNLLLNAFEIIGIPNGAIESTEELAHLLSKLLNINVEEDTIESIQIVESQPVGISEDGSITQAKVTIVYMKERCFRDRIVHLAGPKLLYFDDVEEPPLLIRDSLTKMNESILKQAQHRASELNIERVWVSDGMIFMRKNETSPCIQIRNEADINKMNLYLTL